MINDFGDFFNSMLDKNNNYEIQLDIYWGRGKVQQYYELVNDLKIKGFTVMRNSKGSHKIINNYKN